MSSFRQNPRLTQITLLAPAKINLWLSIIKREKGGYHSLLSMMQMVNLYDRISIRVSPKTSGTRLVTRGGKLPSRGNLVLKAVGSFRRAFGFRRGLRITLDKRIPVGAGLAGGSSDAAATLAGLARLHRTPVSRRSLSLIGQKLGSDVPFFLSGPSAWVTGIGHEVNRFPSPRSYWVVLVNPGFEVSSAWTYRNWDRQFPRREADLSKIIKKLGLTSEPKGLKITSPGASFSPFSSGAPRPRNDLEVITIGRYPVIAGIKRRLRDLGAGAAMMSGSGPTVFGLFKDRKTALKAASAFDKEIGGAGQSSRKLNNQAGQWQIWVARTLSRSPF